MSTVDRVRRVLELVLEIVCMLLMIGLAVVVVTAVAYRWAGASLVWYDEVAAIMLAWLTYYGAALAGVFDASPAAVRVAMLIVSETMVIGFFLVIAWYGWDVIVILAGGSLTSLPWVSVAFTQSVIPIGCALIAIAEMLTIPERWREVRGRAHADQHEETVL
jgi:TRAP-type C4-dicarboxylate transport system permease small subunit